MESLSQFIPPILEASKVLLAALASEAAITSFSLLVDAGTRQKHEKQLQECLKLAFKQTKKELKWTVNEKEACTAFQSSLVSFAGNFDQDSLKLLLEIAISKEVSAADVEIWVNNLFKQLSLKDHEELREYLNLHHIFADSNKQKNLAEQPDPKTKYILTSSASIYDNPEIICRDEFIDELLQMLSSGRKRIQITGMGGLGKTEVLTKLFAKLAADKQHSSFDHIAYIRFSGDILSDIESQVDYPRQYLGLQGIEAAKRYLHDLCADKNVLLCVDDIRANQKIVIENHPSIQYLRSLGANIALAARAGFPDFERNDLSFLSTKACIELFEKKYSRSVSDATDVEILTNIIENRAGNHTLIINRLGNMAKDYGWSILVLADRLKEKDFNFQKGIADEELLQQEINKLYQVNDDLNAAEKNILEAFSIFPAIPLAVDLCAEWLHEDAEVAEDSCLLLLNKLAEKTWLERRVDIEDSATYVMHQLVRTAVQKQIAIKHSAHQKLVNSCTTTLSKSNSSFDLKKSSHIVPFANSICSQKFQDVTNFHVLQESIARYYYETADYNTSYTLYKEILNMRTSLLGEEHPDTATTCDDIGGVLYFQGDYKQAFEWYTKALLIREKTLGTDHPDTGTTYCNIALVYARQGKYYLALEWHQKALMIREKVFGKDHPDTAITYNNIASVYNNQWKYDLALEWYMKALVIVKKLLGEDHPNTASTYNNIASVYNNQGKYDLALEWHQKALTIRKNVLGKEHPNTASTYNNIALVYKNQEKYDLALEWCMKALAIIKKKLGENHPNAAITYNSIASVYESQGKHDLAFEWYHKALVIREKVLGKDHPDTAMSYNNIAGVYYIQGHYDLALEWYQKALVIHENVLGEDHPDIATTYNNIAVVYFNQKKLILALKWFQKALTIRENKLGKDHLYTKETKDAIEFIEKLI